MSDCEQCKSFYLELERLRRLVPTGTYTLNVAHEEEIQRLKDAGEVLIRSLERMTKERDEARAELAFIQAEYTEANESDLTRDALCLRAATLRLLADKAAAEQGLAQRRMMEAQATRDKALRLAYMGEHYFEDLSWKAQHGLLFEDLAKMREALRAAEKRELEALAELDEERAEAERWRNAHHEASIRLQAHDCGEEAAKLYERAGRAEEAVTKLGEQLNASEADCERFGKLLDDCRNVLLGQYDPDSVNAMIHRIDDAIGPWESVAP